MPCAACRTLGEIISTYYSLTCPDTWMEGRIQSNCLSMTLVTLFPPQIIAFELLFMISKNIEEMFQVYIDL